MFVRMMSLAMLAGLLLIESSCVRAEAPLAESKSAKPASAPAPAAEAKPVAEPAAVIQTQTAEAPVAESSAIEVAQAAAKSQPSTPPQAAVKKAEPSPQPATASNPKIPAKQEILNSPEWRRAMFEFGEWLTAQQIYTPAQVQQIKDQFNRRVAAMDANELAYLLADMQAKFQIMNSPEAREARAWMAQYLSVMSDRKRAELLKDVPNIATMTAAQLNAEIQKIIERRQTLEDSQAAFQRGQAQQVANQLQTDRINQQNYVRDWNTGPVAYSPYRSQSNVNERLNNTPTGAGMGFYVGPFGGVGMTFAPSSW